MVAYLFQERLKTNRNRITLSPKDWTSSGFGYSSLVQFIDLMSLSIILAAVRMTACFSESLSSFYISLMKRT